MVELGCPWEGRSRRGYDVCNYVVFFLFSFFFFLFFLTSNNLARRIILWQELTIVNYTLASRAQYLPR